MQAQGERYLRAAVRANVDMKDVYIGDNCLPTWPNYFWDHERETAHSELQQRLMSQWIAKDLGDILYREIRVKGNARLERARQLGIQIREIRMGSDLLPTWSTDIEMRSAIDDWPRPRRAACSDQSVDNEGVPSTYTDTDVEDSGQDSELAQTSGFVEGGYETVDMAIGNEALGSKPFNQSSFPTIPSVPLSNSWTNVEVGVSRPVSSSTTSDSDSDFDEGTDTDASSGDVISLKDFAQDGRQDYTDGTENIFHDAEVVDGFQGPSCEVDLEVYIAEDDEEVDDLPEIELGVDRAAFEYHCGIAEAVDIEAEGFVIRCSDIPVEGPEDGIVDEIMAEPQSRAIGVVIMSGTNDKAEGLGGHVSEDSSMSEEITSDEDESGATAWNANTRGVIETESGFEW